MYVCQECNNVFSDEESRTRLEDMGEYFGSPSGREYLVCPSCGSNDIEEAKKCELCEEWVHTESYDGEHYCDECVEYIKKKFGDLITNNFNEKERKLIYWCIDIDTWINKD